MIFGNDVETVDVTEDEFNKLLFISSCQVMSHCMDNYDLYAKVACQFPKRFLVYLDDRAICATDSPVSDLKEDEDILNIRSMGIGYGMVFCRWENDSAHCEPPERLKPMLIIQANGKYTAYPMWEYIFGKSYKTRRLTDEQIERLIESYDTLKKVRDL